MLRLVCFVCVCIVRAERLPILEQYETMWRDYQSTYETFSLAKLLKQKVKERQHAVERCRQAGSQLDDIRTQLNTVQASAGMLQVFMYLRNILNEFGIKIVKHLFLFHKHFKTIFFKCVFPPSIMGDYTS